MLYLRVNIRTEFTYTGKKYLVKRMLGRIYSRRESIREAMEHNIDAFMCKHISVVGSGASVDKELGFKWAFQPECNL